MTDLESELRDAMMEQFRRCKKEIHYNPTLVLHYMSEHGATETARWLVNLPHDTSGLTKLWMEGRLNLSVEALVVQPPFAPLFSIEDRRTAYATLAKLQFQFPAGISRP
jgi:hypothetical protein